MAQKKEKKNSFFADFKKFLSRGNILDLAVAVIIGAAFGKIVTSLVNDIIMPLVSLALGGVSVYDWKWVIKEAEYDDVTGLLTKSETALNYGTFIMAILDFLIIAFCIFMIIRIIVKAQSGFKKLTHKEGEEASAAEEAPAAPPAPTQEQLLTEIRDLLKQSHCDCGCGENHSGLPPA